jgi:PAS domain S-box-containing protein
MNRSELQQSPLRSVNLAVVFTLVFFLYAGWHTWRSHEHYQNNVVQQVRLYELIGQIRQGDAMLTLYVQLAATSGDARWTDTYYHMDRQLANAIREAIDLDPQAFGGNNKFLDQLNRTTTDLERQALQLIKLGSHADALALLRMPVYENLKRTYLRGLFQASANLNQHVQDEMSKQWQWTFFFSTILLIAVPVSVLIWLAVLGTMRNYLAGKKQVEDALAHERDLFKALLDTIPDRIYFKDRQSRFIRCSRSVLKRFGLTSMEQVAGKTDFDFHPDTQAREFFGNEQQIIETRQPLIGKIERRVEADGRVLWSMVDKVPVINEQGEVTGIVGISHDITALKEAEAELRENEELNRTLLSSLPQRVFYKNKELVFQGANDAFARDLGCAPEAIIGKTDFDFFPKDLALKYRDDDRQVMAASKPVIIEEINMVNGQERVVEVMKAPVIDDEGNLMGLVGLFTDITERKKAEEKLRAFAMRLEQNNRELQEFAYVASHDLQEPLRKVRAFGDRLKAKCGASFTVEGRDYLERMQNAAGRMQTLIEALLAYSRISTRAQPFVPVKLNKIIQEVLSDLEVRIEQVGGKVEVENLPEIEADAMQMRQLFQNLIGNALKFTRPGIAPVVKVHCEAMVSDSENTGGRLPIGRNYFRIYLQDNGIGFDEKYLDRIFTVFQRLHGRNEYEGSGVGLAICRKIVMRHNGDITARSQPGQGATFIIILPLKQQEN